MRKRMGPKTLQNFLNHFFRDYVTKDKDDARKEKFALREKSQSRLGAKIKSEPCSFRWNLLKGGISSTSVLPLKSYQYQHFQTPSALLKSWIRNDF